MITKFISMQGGVDKIVERGFGFAAPLPKQQMIE